LKINCKNLEISYLALSIGLIQAQLQNTRLRACF